MPIVNEITHEKGLLIVVVDLKGRNIQKFLKRQIFLLFAKGTLVEGLFFILIYCIATNVIHDNAKRVVPAPPETLNS